MSCPIKVNSDTIELTVHTSCYWVLDLLCVTTLDIYTMHNLFVLYLSFDMWINNKYLLELNRPETKLSHIFSTLICE